MSYASLSDSDMMALFPTEAEMQSVLGPLAKVDSASVSQRPQKPSETARPNLRSVSTPQNAVSGTGPTPPTRSFSQAATPSRKVSGYHTLPDQWVLDELPTPDDASKNVKAIGDLLSKCDSFEHFDPGAGAVSGWTMKPHRNHDFATSVVWVSKGDVLEMFGANGDTAQQAQDLAIKMVPVMAKRLEALAPKK